jgi:hypothetical protein
MPVDPEGINTFQLALLDFEKTSSSSFELFPKVWGAAEALTDIGVVNRQTSLDCLDELSAARFSPLVAFLLFSRITDPDLMVRARIIKMLAEVLRPDSQGQFAPEPVRQNLLFNLTRMQLREIFMLLETAEFDASTTDSVATLLKVNHLAGGDLTIILADRKMPLAVRRQAANFIAQVGYIDAVPGIERLINRLDARVNGQQTFIMNSVDALDELELLPILQSVLKGLKAP